MITETLPIGDLSPSPQNPRHGTGDVRPLAASIKAHGLLQPLVVVKNGTSNTYTVIAGARRLAALQLLRRNEAPCVIVEAPANDRPALMLIENLQREDLAPLEEAEALAVLLSMKGPNGARTQGDIAKEIGKTQAWVSYRLSLLELPQVAQDALHNGVIGLEQARDLAKVADRPDVVDRVVARIAAGDKAPVAQAVRDESRVLELEAEADAARADLKKRKVRVLSRADTQGEAMLVPEPLSVGFIREMSDEEHDKLPCHAVLVDVHWNRVEIEAYCLDPASHGADDASEDAERAASRAAADAQRQVLELAQAARLEACAELCKRQATKAAAEVIEWALIGDQLGIEDMPPPVLVARILEFAPASEDVALADEDEQHLAERIVEHARTSDRTRSRTALAVALALVEDAIGRPWPPSWSSERVHLHFDALATVGYEPVEAERALLEPIVEVGSDAE